jgi:leucyl-tRNA synthetase
MLKWNKENSMSDIPSYTHQEIESKWQTAWDAIVLNTPDTKNAKKPFFNLMMFPYPSAEGLHVGNMYAFTGSDIFGRFKRMQGYTVLEPIGLDGFGIHSENYSMKVGRHPIDHSKITEKNFYRQLRTIGAMFDWTRTVETYNPNYYRFTQWIFLKLFKRGLVYRGSAMVNWCPSCKTVLSDEQVIDSKCERCGNTVIKKQLEQWFCKITAYAEKLHEHIPSLQWSEKVKVAQKNWIGKKKGITITYEVVDDTGKKIDTISCFTTRPDTNFGATFVVVAPEHQFVTRILEVIKDKEKVETIRSYINKTTQISQEERIAQGRKKTGVATGFYAVNQLTGHTMPIYVSDFVLSNFGTGAVVGVPGHDLRDFEFACSFNISIVRVVVGPDGDSSVITEARQVQEADGIMVNSGFLNGLSIHDATEKIMDYLEEKGWGKKETTYHLRDWIISRQRYWGPPIPMIYCERCAKDGNSWFTTKDAEAISKEQKDSLRSSMTGWYPVPEDQLPLELPYIEDFKPGDDGIPPLAKHKEFYEAVCPGCGGKARRETEVSDTFLDSSWYFLRYPSVSQKSEDESMPAGEAGRKSVATDNKTLPWDPEITKKWLPVAMYTGGAEHSVLHLMYSRFVTMALYDMGYITFDEPFANFFAHGLVIKDGAKMSKSKGNVVNPDEYIKLYGSDALRLYLMFMGPYSEGGDFRDSSMEGMYKWVGRVWRLSHTVLSSATPKESSEDVTRALHRLVKKATEDIEKRQYNTTIACMMEFTNVVNDQDFALSVDDLKTFLLVLAPFAPHVTEELWAVIHERATLKKSADSIHTQAWPTFDPAKTVDQTIELVVQINGKVRDRMVVMAEEAANEELVKTKALDLFNIKKQLIDKKISKAIFVPRRLINIVVVE